MDELNVAANVLGDPVDSAAPTGESVFPAEQGFAEMPYPSETPNTAGLFGQQVSPPGPTAEEIAQAEAAEAARVQEAENARIQEAMKPHALTTASVFEVSEEAGGADHQPVEDNREFAIEAIEEPLPGVELIVDRAEMTAENATDTFTESTEVLADEPVEGTAEAVVTFATEEPGDALPEPLGQFQGVVAAEVAVPVPVVSAGIAGAVGDALSTEEAGGEPETYGLATSPAGAASEVVAAPRSASVAPRAPARRPRRRSQGGGIVGIVGVMLSGLLGMSLVYYAFNWLGGPRYDFLKFPLPGLRHTYKHLSKYPSLPRFGVDPDAEIAAPKNGALAEPGNGSKKKVSSKQTLGPAEDAGPAQETEPATPREDSDESAMTAAPAKKAAPAAKSKNGSAKSGSAKSGPAKSGAVKKPAQSDPLFDMDAPDFSPAAPTEKKASTPAKPQGDAAKSKGEPAKSKGAPAKKKTADDDAPFDMPEADPADSLKIPNLTPPGST